MPRLPRGRAAWPIYLAIAIVVVGLIIVLATRGPSNAQDSNTTTGPTVPTTIPFDIKHNARADVVPGACVPSGGRLTMSGSVMNSSQVTRRYQIVVDFTSVPGNTVLDTKIVNIASLASQQKIQWSATSNVGISNANCVIRFAQSWPTS